jgi:hypothetical protein
VALMPSARRREAVTERNHPGAAWVAQQVLDGEQALIAALLRQVLTDACSGLADIRQEARRFIADPQGLRWWDECLGLNGALLRLMQAALRGGREPGGQRPGHPGGRPAALERVRLRRV